MATYRPRAPAVAGSSLWKPRFSWLACWLRACCPGVGAQEMKTKSQKESEEEWFSTDCTGGTDHRQVCSYCLTLPACRSRDRDRPRPPARSVASRRVTSRRLLAYVWYDKKKITWRESARLLPQAGPYDASGCEDPTRLPQPLSRIEMKMTITNKTRHFQLKTQ